jgi:hypothetical protein
MLLTIGSDLTSGADSFNGIGYSVRWMSPELLNMEESNEGPSPTQESDRYALGMVIYEVLSGTIPFHQYPEPGALLRIVRGKHPRLPEGEQGVWFTKELWEMLKLCWSGRPGDRPGLDAILRCLQGVTRPSRLPSCVSESIIRDKFEVSSGGSSAFVSFYPVYHYSSLWCDRTFRCAY